MYAPPPGAPVEVVTWTLGAFPASAETTFDSWEFTTSSASTELTVTPIFSR